MKTFLSAATWSLLVLVVSACNPGSGDSNDAGKMLDGGKSTDGGMSSTPTILSTSPANAAIDVALNTGVSVTFSEPMKSASLTSNTFTLTTGAAVSVPGTVIYSNSKAVFWPAAHLASNSVYTATVTTGVQSAHGVAIATQRVWTFNTGTAVLPDLPVNLGTSGDFVILAKSGISTVPTSAITGDIGVSPAAASYITGFGLSEHSSTVYSTSPQVTGKVYAADYTAPTPFTLTNSIGDMEIAFTDTAARAPDATELGAGNIGGMTLTSGVYKWGTGLLIPTDVTLSGSATDVFIFQVAQDLTVSNAVNVILIGGALPKNIFWQVSGKVTLGTTSHFEGIVLAQTSITMETGASVNGRLLAQTAVALDGNTVVQPLP